MVGIRKSKLTCGGYLSGSVCKASLYTANARCNFPWSAYNPPSCSNDAILAFSWADRSLKPTPSNFEASLKTEAASWHLPNAISDVPRFKYATEKKKKKEIC